MKPPVSELNAEALYQALIAQIRPALEGIDHVAIAGIRSGGAWIAERMASDLGLETPPGFIDVSFYRDDYAERACQQKSNRHTSRLTSMVPPSCS